MVWVRKWPNWKKKRTIFGFELFISVLMWQHWTTTGLMFFHVTGPLGKLGDRACYEVLSSSMHIRRVWMITQSVPIHTSICLHCHPKHLRMANEVTQKADQFEDLYSKLLKIQQSACVVGVPDRPAGILWLHTQLCQTCSHWNSFFCYSMQWHALASKAKDELTALMVQCTQTDVACNYLLVRSRIELEWRQDVNAMYASVCWYHHAIHIPSYQTYSYYIS